MTLHVVGSFRMVRKPERVYAQSGVVPYRIRDGDVEVLLVTSRSGRRWVIPKGLVEPYLTPRASAAKEALEEAGIIGRVSTDTVGRYEYRKWGGTCKVDVFLMRVEQEFSTWQENDRTREWVPLDEAARRARETDLRDLLLGLPRVLRAR